MPALPPIRSHTALRGLAALLVVFYHLHFGAEDPLPFETATPFFARGYLWVDLFFVLSGFILSYVNRADVGARFGRGEAAGFWRSRFARVYPLHLVVLAGYAGAAALLTVWSDATGRLPPVAWDAGSLGTLALQALLANAWFEGREGWNVPSWSISAEAIAYFLFPLLVTARTARPRATTAAMLLGALAFFGWRAAAGGSLDLIGGPPAVLRCLAGFAGGMLVYQGRGWFARLRATPLALVQAATATGIVAVLATATNDVAAIPLFVLLVGTTWQDRGPLARLLGRRPLLWLGEVSYSVYLLHVPVISLLKFGWARTVPRLGLDLATERAFWIATVLAVVLGLASLTFRFVERPARQWLARRWLGHGVSPIATAPAAP